MSITVESFTLEADSSLIDDPTITQLFVEYQLLDYNYGDVETPSSLPRPSPGESIVFDFRKGEGNSTFITVGDCLSFPLYMYIHRFCFESSPEGFVSGHDATWRPF